MRVLSPYISASFDADLTEAAVILPYLLILSLSLSASFDPDLTEKAVVPAYVLVLSIPLSQFRSRFDQDCCDYIMPAGSMAIFPS